MPKFCDSCGSELKNENAKFCDKCGAEVKTNQNESNSETVSGVVCPKCGTTNPIGQKVCSNCGEYVVLENNTVAVIVGYIGLWTFTIISLITGIYLLTRPNGKSKTQGLLLIIFMILDSIIAFTMYSYLYYFPDYLIKSLTIAVIGTIIGLLVWFSDLKILN